VLGLNRDDAEPLSSPGLPERRPSVRPAKEVLHGAVEVAEGLLLDGLAPGAEPIVLAPRNCELAALLQVTRRALPAVPPPRMLLDGEVPYEPCVRAVLPPYLLLGTRRNEPVAGHNPIVLSTIPERGERRFLHGINAGVSAPRLR
jgi:hypothetical protein